jgi:hypothetical protein
MTFFFEASLSLKSGMVILEVNIEFQATKVVIDSSQSVKQFITPVAFRNCRIGL